MPDIIDAIYGLRDVAGAALEPLRSAIAEAQQVLDKLEAFADDAENAAELVASSDRHASHHASTPADSGLVPAREQFANDHARDETHTDVACEQCGHGVYTQHDENGCKFTACPCGRAQ